MADWLRRPIRHVLRLAPWQAVTRIWQPTGPLIADLVGPLRLDILVMRDFLRLYLDRLDLATKSFDSFVQEARRHRFWDLVYGWFSLYQPEAVRDPQVFNEHFAMQVRRSILLWHRVADDPEPSPVVEVKTAARTLPTTTGKSVHSRYGLGEHSYRVACFMLLGHQVLPAGSFCYRWYRRRRPYDGTWVLTHRKAFTPTEYFRYLSEVYGAGERFTTEEGLRRFVEAVSPGRLEELRSVVRADGYSEG